MPLGSCWSRGFRYITFVVVLGWFAAAPLAAQQFDPNLFAGMRWRMIGPFRAGRALTAVGVPGQPNLFYFGAVGGGVWKTTNAGRAWVPIFDSEPIASIGDMAVAPSDPKVIYVGSGEADMRSDISYGNGMYKSVDGGKTWAHIGLEDTRQIGRVLIDPHNPDVVFVAALGHGYGPNSERGVFRTTDGGANWQRVLFKNENTGAIDLAFDPRNAHVIYAALWQTRRPPWSIYPPSNGYGSGLYKSTDGGDTWQQLTGHGLPSESLGRIGIAVAPSEPDRVYLLADAKAGGVYRSDDAGQTWQHTDSERRIWQRGWYFGGITVDPKDPDTVYVANTTLYRSRDGGKSFDAIKGAPGGDDYHSLWIEPDDPSRMIVSSDQGVVISVDGGKTWTSWYNQPTAQFYHVITTPGFPYLLCGAQQDSGSACTTSRSNAATITFRDWRTIGVGGESQYIAPDESDPNILYGGSFGAAVGRYDMITSQTQDIAPMLAHPGEYRRAWTLPTVASPDNPQEYYHGTQVLFRTMNGGQTWQIISPDLTREDPGVPPNLDPPTVADAPQGKRRGVIYAIAPSPLRPGEIWIGTDDGLIQVTRDDGETWHDVTPPALTPWSKIGILEASHFDVNTVYAAVDRHRLDDLAPHIYRTHDGGKTWQEIVRGIPEGSYVNAVREDPERKGLLYAGTETGVFVSFDDGDEWQPLQLNLPNASVRDMVIHGDDLVIATHGRSFWILDDLTPLRQLTHAVAKSDVYLFKPQTALRVRPITFEGTPLPHDEPQAENPPTGAILDYYLKSASAGPMSLEILDSNGKLVRRYSSQDKPPKIDPKRLTITMDWVRQPQPLSAEAGMHRFVWDLHYAGEPVPRSLMAAIFGFGGGPWAPPGAYTVRLTANGHTYEQPLVLKKDPRVKTPDADLWKQFAMARRIEAAQAEVARASREADRLQEGLKSLTRQKGAPAKVVETAKALARKTEQVGGITPPPNPEFAGVGEPSEDRTSLRFLNGALGELQRAVESADVAPTPDAVGAFQDDQQALSKALAQWDRIKTHDLPQLNALLRESGLRVISLEEAKAKSVP
jgi:photosystem II stability/assembly factor-like uncharacterized protein